jgi:hypothetical protein
VLQAYAADRRAGVLIIGVYGHSRFREFVLGGAKGGVFSLPPNADIPIARCHCRDVIGRARDLGFRSIASRLMLDLRHNKARASADVKRLSLDHVRESDAKIRRFGQHVRCRRGPRRGL